MWQFNSFDFNFFWFIFLQANINDASLCIKEPYKSFSEMKADGLILERPSIIFELLIDSLAIAS